MDLPRPPWEVTPGGQAFRGLGRGQATPLCHQGAWISFNNVGQRACRLPGAPLGGGGGPRTSGPEEDTGYGGRDSDTREGYGPVGGWGGDGCEQNFRHLPSTERAWWIAGDSRDLSSCMCVHV